MNTQKSADPPLWGVTRLSRPGYHGTGSALSSRAASTASGAREARTSAHIPVCSYVYVFYCLHKILVIRRRLARVTRAARASRQQAWRIALAPCSRAARARRRIRVGAFRLRPLAHESGQPCKRSQSTESSKHCKSKSAKTTRSSKARVARAAGASRQQAWNIALGAFRLRPLDYKWFENLEKIVENRSRSPPGASETRKNS